MKKYLLYLILACTGALTLAAGVVNTPDRQSALSLTETRSQTGNKIAVADAYGVQCSDSPLRAYDYSYTIDNECYNVGWSSYLRYINGGYQMKLYGEFLVPVNISVIDNDGLLSIETVRFRAGERLAVVEKTVTVGFNRCREIRSLYAIPEQWLRNLNDTTTCVIEGHFDSDETLSFEGCNFAFFISDEIYVISTGELLTDKSYYTLSPLFTNMRFLNPNGTHAFKRINGNCPTIDVARESSMRHYVINKETPPSGSGSGGRVSRPIDPRPIKNRLDAIEASHPLLADFGSGTDEEGERYDPNTTTVEEPVYIVQDNDTVYVYNLYGTISEVNVFYLRRNGQMVFPAQPVDQATENSVYQFPDSSSPMLENPGYVSPDSLTWGVTVPVNISGMMGYYYDSNSLFFTDGSEFYISGIAVTGDVNRDGLISVSDVTALIAALLRGQQANTNTFSSEAADCNHDNQIGINDVTALINYLLSHSW